MVMLLGFISSFSLISILFTPLYDLIIAVYYLDLLVRKEALDLEWTAHTTAPTAPPPPTPVVENSGLTIAPTESWQAPADSWQAPGGFAPTALTNAPPPPTGFAAPTAPTAPTAFDAMPAPTAPGAPTTPVYGTNTIDYPTQATRPVDTSDDYSTVAPTGGGASATDAGSVDSDWPPATASSPQDTAAPVDATSTLNDASPNPPGNEQTRW
jgi:hypothetical protein